MAPRELRDIAAPATGLAELLLLDAEALSDGLVPLAGDFAGEPASLGGELPP